MKCTFSAAQPDYTVLQNHLCMINKYKPLRKQAEWNYDLNRTVHIVLLATNMFHRDTERVA